jgi:hypothetical protein
MANRHLDRVLQTDYLEGLADWPIEEIRAHRAECQRLEDAASYLRRLVQTRLDILGMELRGRAVGEDVDLGQLIERLPTILTDPASHRNTGGRLLGAELGEDQERWAQSVVGNCCGEHDVESAPEMSVEKLKSLADCLADLELHVSAERRKLHDVFDQLQAELVQRYKTGKASVDRLLQ